MDKSTFNLPFRGAEGFFRRKLNIPTEKWDDLWQAEHAQGFMSAGAMKADLLADLRNEVDKAIAGGLTVKEFREQFSSLVEKHGWGHKGGRKWRSDLIYDTNVTTAYQAGRWQQFKAGGTEYLMYVHADGVRHPRPQHLAWHGRVLPIEHEFWRTHYPPNGWGCKCRAVRADAHEQTAPPPGYDRIDPQTAAPQGIDNGWAYNVGQAGQEGGYTVLTRKLETLPYEIARAWTESMLASPPFELFYKGKLAVDFPVAVLNPLDRDALGARTQTVWFSPQSLKEHLDAHPDIGLKDYQKIQRVMEEGEVYQQGGERLIFLKLDGKLYRAAVKTTQDKGENFFLTLFETTAERKKTQEIRKMKRIR